MPASDDANLCPFCRRGRLAEQDRDIAFHQSTDKGYVFCRVTIPVTVCEHCRSVTWTDEAEAIIERAVRREYEKLP
jgi:hypothetical protein